MMPFFFTMPMSRMISDDADHVEIMARKPQGEQCAEPCGRQRRQNRERMNKALGEHAQDHVHRRAVRREDQHRLILQDSWNACAIALETSPAILRRHAHID